MFVEIGDAMTRPWPSLLGGAVALGILAVSAASRPAVAWPFYLDDLGTTNDLVGIYPGWPHDSQGNNGCVTCHVTNTPVFQNGSRNPYGILFKNNNHNYTAIEGADSDGDGAVNGLELSLGFYPANPASKPVPPANVQASDALFADKVQVTWTPLSGASAYEVYRSLTNTGLVKIGQSSGSSFDDTTVASGEFYSYAVKACNSHGCTALSATDTGFTQAGAIAQATDKEIQAFLHDPSAPGATGADLNLPPLEVNPFPPPNGVDASDGSIGQQVKVTWQARAGAHLYAVYRSTSKILPPIPLFDDRIGKTSGTEFLDSTAAVGEVYWYSVRACYNAGCSGQSALDAGWRYTATPTDEMITLTQQGGGERVISPSALREPAIIVAPVRRPTEDVAPVVRERQPAEEVAPMVRERQPAVRTAPAVDEIEVPERGEIERRATR